MSEARATAPRVTVLPATRNRFTTAPIASVQKRRVAAYARVSTDSDEQLTSYEAQVDYYTHYIKERPDWAFAGMYADEGISGTNTKRREGFNQMIADALAGKIDLIVTKSVSRFARNTVDSLTTVRKLKEKGVEVYFQKENIYTLDSKGELLITIMSSLAQEESRSISENVTWGQRKRFSDGKVSMPYKHFLGYRKGEDGEPEIVPEEAEVVRRIYRLFLEGQTPYGIKRILERAHVPTPAGKETWQTATILSILTNEKYKGDALLQKTFCTDFLTKKMKVNEGEVPQYYVENSHTGHCGTGGVRSGAGGTGEKEANRQSTPRHELLCGKARVRLLRRALRQQGVAFHGSIPPCHLAVQWQIQGKGKVRYATPDRRDDPAEIPLGLQ